jgi:hypothetical protein
MTQLNKTKKEKRGVFFPPKLTFEKKEKMKEWKRDREREREE